MIDEREREFHDQFYDAEAERVFSSPLYRRLLDLHVRLLIEVTPDLAAARVLSVGCGDGRRELAAAPYAGEIVAIDASPVAIDRAKERARRLGIQNVTFQVADSESLEERCGSPVDALWCFGILHHLADGQVAALLRSSAAALKRGGRFVSMDPNAQRAVKVFKPLFRRQYDRYHTPGERELKPRDVAEQFRAAGFREIEIRFTDAFISPLAWLFPRLTASLAPLLVRLDQLLVKAPVVKELSSGFAVIARNRL